MLFTALLLHMQGNTLQHITLTEKSNYIEGLSEHFERFLR